MQQFFDFEKASLELCFDCQLADCVGVDDQTCPIRQRYVELYGAPDRCEDMSGLVKLKDAREKWGLNKNTATRIIKEGGMPGEYVKRDANGGFWLTLAGVEELGRLKELRRKPAAPATGYIDLYELAERFPGVVINTLSQCLLKGRIKCAGLLRGSSNRWLIPEVEAARVAAEVMELKTQRRRNCGRKNGNGNGRKSTGALRCERVTSRTSEGFPYSNFGKRRLGDGDDPAGRPVAGKRRRGGVAGGVVGGRVDGQVSGSR